MTNDPLVDIKAEVDAAPLEQMSLAPERLTHFVQRYDELISQGLKANPPPKNLLDRLLQFKPQVLAFIRRTISLCMTFACPSTTTQPNAMSEW